MSKDAISTDKSADLFQLASISGNPQAQSVVCQSCESISQDISPPKQNLPEGLEQRVYTSPLFLSCRPSHLERFEYGQERPRGLTDRRYRHQCQTHC